MFVVRKGDAKLGKKIDRFCGREKRFAKTRKHVARSLERRGFHMTIGTNPWNWTLARKELLPVAIQTRRMFRKLGHIRKRRVGFAYFLPVLSGSLVTRIAREFLFGYVSGM